MWSWWKPQGDQIPRHYEVCDKHASVFVGQFNRSASEKVADEYEASDA